MSSLSEEQKQALQAIANRFSQHNIPYSVQMKLHYHVWDCIQFIRHTHPDFLVGVTRDDVMNNRLVVFDANNVNSFHLKTTNQIEAYYKANMAHLISIEDIPSPAYESIYG